MEDDLTRLLNDDLLAGILRRVGARGLAASRVVCKAWAATVDARGLLRPHLLPHSLAGVFVNFNGLHHSEFFSRPAPSSSSSTSTGGAPGKKLASYTAVHDHCNGLLLLSSSVVNPATGWKAPLPPRPLPVVAGGMEYILGGEYLAYDPAVSPDHYQVFLMPWVPYIEFHQFGQDPEFHQFGFGQDPEDDELELVDPPAMLGPEWPPSPYVMRVFSSATGRWEERTFLREGEPAGNVARVTWGCTLKKRNAVCWRGALYVHCQNNFLMRISLSDDTYQVIRLPGDVGLENYTDDLSLQLGRSEKGVYFAIFSDDQLRVWILNEMSNQKYEWVLKHDNDDFPLFSLRQGHYGPWILQDANLAEERTEIKIGDNNTDTTAIDHGKYEWSSDDDDEGDVRDTKGMVVERIFGIEILGFHPFKEIIFLSTDSTRGLAYHLNTSKLQDLGNLQPKHDGDVAGPNGFIEASFMYTPCLIPLNNVTDTTRNLKYQEFFDEIEGGEEELPEITTIVF